MEILKLIWKRQGDGVFAIAGMQSLKITPTQTADHFPLPNDLVVTQSPPNAGTLRWFLEESIVPVVANMRGEKTFRCVGTAFFVSCSGLLITAAHVITDPIERKYGKISEHADGTLEGRELTFGVLVPNNPLFQVPGHSFYPFDWSLFLAERHTNPMPIPGLDLKLTSDIAICKVAPKSGRPHQPLTVVQPGIVGVGMGVASTAYALGYAGMSDFEINEHGVIGGTPKFHLHASIGPILERFPDNFSKKMVPTPGPCFSFEATVPGGMSGGPIYDREGIYVHGVISKGWEDEKGPIKFSFGSMLRPSMSLPISRMEGRSLAELQAQKNEGMPILRAPDI